MACGVVAVIAAASGCLSTTGTIKRVTNYDTPDPAAVSLGGAMAQMYTTKAGIPPYVSANVPSYRVDTQSFGGYLSTPVDALPSLPVWVKTNTAACQANPWDCSPYDWAPTVRVVGGKYLMMFSGSRQAGYACIGAAWSSRPEGPFTPMGTQWCDGSSGLLDPQLFVAPDGKVWVYYSLQQPWRNYSEIRAQQISFNGFSIATIGGPTTLVTVDQARSTCGIRNPVTNCAMNAGATPAGHYVENPAMVKDPYNGYNLLVSVGNWQDNSYTTVEIPCLSPNSNCAPGYGAPIMFSSSDYAQSGGASLLRDDSPTNNVIFFHARRPGESGRTAHMQNSVAVQLPVA